MSCMIYHHQYEVVISFLIQLKALSSRHPVQVNLLTLYHLLNKYIKKKKESDFEDSKKGELLIDEEEKQVGEKYTSKVEDDEDSTS